MKRRIDPRMGTNGREGGGAIHSCPFGFIRGPAFAFRIPHSSLGISRRSVRRCRFRLMAFHPSSFILHPCPSPLPLRALRVLRGESSPRRGGRSGNNRPRDACACRSDNNRHRAPGGGAAHHGQRHLRGVARHLRGDARHLIHEAGGLCHEPRRPLHAPACGVGLGTPPSVAGGDLPERLGWGAGLSGDRA